MADYEVTRIQTTRNSTETPSPLDLIPQQLPVYWKYCCAIEYYNGTIPHYTVLYHNVCMTIPA